MPNGKKLKKRGFFFGLGTNIIVLGIASLLTDLSTEMILPILPIFASHVLGAFPATYGLIEGIAESAASLLKVFSGWWSDRIGMRKHIVVAGYSISTIVKPILAFASHWTHILGVRFTDRVGKGLRTPPRDALITDSCAPDVRGKAFGLHRALDTIGAILGPLLALVLMFFIWVRDILLLAFIPALIAVLILILFAREVKRKPNQVSFIASIGSLSPAFRRYLAVVTLFSLANMSYGFLILRAIEIGGWTNAKDMLIYTIPLYLLFNVAYVLVSLPVGIISDRVGRPPIIALGYVMFGFTTAGFALANSMSLVILLFVLYGAFMGSIEGTQRAYVADLADPKLRGIAMGAFHTAVGVALLPASIVAGALWQAIGSWATFAFASAISFIAAALIVVVGLRAH